MTTPGLLAQGHTADGISPIDLYSPAHLAVGFVAGTLGIPSSVAMVGFIAARLVSGMITEGSRKAFFGRGSSESLSNELADVSLEILGVAFGKYVREQYKAKQAAAAQPPTEVPPQTQENMSGVGAYYIDPVVRPINGIGAYYQDPVVRPISGLGAYYVDPVVRPIR